VHEFPGSKMSAHFGRPTRIKGSTGTVKLVAYVYEGFFNRTACLTVQPTNNAIHNDLVQPILTLHIAHTSKLVYNANPISSLSPHGYCSAISTSKMGFHPFSHATESDCCFEPHRNHPIMVSLEVGLNAQATLRVKPSVLRMLRLETRNYFVPTVP
jgi:hypothetical protein